MTICFFQFGTTVNSQTFLEALASSEAWLSRLLVYVDKKPRKMLNCLFQKSDMWVILFQAWLSTFLAHTYPVLCLHVAFYRSSSQMYQSSIRLCDRELGRHWAAINAQVSRMHAAQVKRVRGRSCRTVGFKVEGTRFWVDYWANCARHTYPQSFYGISSISCRW